MKKAKCQYRTKIESYYTGSDAIQMWQGYQNSTDYKGKHSYELPSDTSLSDELNYFYARFEEQHRSILESTSCSGRLYDHAYRSDVIKIFKQVNIHKAAGSYGLPGRVL